MADPNNSFTNDRSESDNDSSQEENRDAVASPNSHGTLLGFLENLAFKYVNFPCDNSQSTFDNRPQRRWYDGPKGLRQGVSTSFDNPFECLSRCGGLDYVLVARLAAGSNDYFHAVIKPTLRINNVWHHHLVWNDITTEEMHHFLGILLRISITPMDAGGYKAYFSKDNTKITFDRQIPGSTLELSDTAGFAHKYMDLRRFQQIRGAFHPTC